MPFEQVTDAVEWADTRQKRLLVDTALSLQNLLARLRVQIGSKDFKTAVAVEPRIELQNVVGDGLTGIGQCFLLAEQVLADTIHQRAFDIENVCFESHLASPPGDGETSIKQARFINLL
jgi:hypothetical protein